MLLACRVTKTDPVPKPIPGSGPRRRYGLPMSRTCARPGCSQHATATLTYAYSAGDVWLDPLSTESHPMSHDLCERHADGMSVPQGWRLDDRRSVPALAPPSEPAEPAFRSALAS